MRRVLRQCAFTSFCILTILALLLQVPSVEARQDASTPTTQKDLLAYEIHPKGGRLGDYFDVQIKAGERRNLTVVIANTGTVDFHARTYAINAFTAPNGGFAAARAGTPTSGATTWLSYPEEQYIIKPGKGIERSFVVRVPKDTPPGEYLTAIALENEPRAVEGTTIFKQVVRFPMPVIITVPGEKNPALEIGKIQLTSAERFSQLDIVIANSGNVRIHPVGTITIADANGKQVFTAPAHMGTVFAHNETTLEMSFPPLAQGNYHVTVSLGDPNLKVVATGDANVTASAPATPPPPPPVRFENATAAPMPDAAHLQFLDVKATISNSGEALTNVKIVLHATKDGKPVEDFALNSSLSVPNGETPIEARYLPATGWTSGDWSFTLSVEAVTGSNGVAQVLATADLGSITIP